MIAAMSSLCSVVGFSCCASPAVAEKFVSHEDINAVVPSTQSADQSAPNAPKPIDVPGVHLAPLTKIPQARKDALL
jgi:hypothetical protein